MLVNFAQDFVLLLPVFTLLYWKLQSTYDGARMAELVDAPDSKSGIRKDVQVRFLFRALSQTTVWFFYCLKCPSVNGFNES